MRKTTSCLPQFAENTFSPTERIDVLPHNAVGGVPRRLTPAGDTLPRHHCHPTASCGTKHPQPPTKDNDTAKVSFFHEFVPPTATAQTRRHTHAGASYLPAGTARAAALLRAVMEAHRPAKEMTGALRVSLLWTWPGDGPAPKTTRPDLDNLAKLALDAMTAAGYWSDDSQVAELTTAKFTGPIPGLAVTVGRMAER